LAIATVTWFDFATPAAGAEVDFCGAAELCEELELLDPQPASARPPSRANVLSVVRDEDRRAITAAYARRIGPDHRIDGRPIDDPKPGSLRNGCCTRASGFGLTVEMTDE
jgi:hypothetical protein